MIHYVFYLSKEYLYDPGAQTARRAEENPRSHHSSTMKNLVALFCVISALLTSVESLVCKSCLNRNGDSCNTEEFVNCGDSSRCCTVSGFTRYNSTTTQFIHKGCEHNLPSGQFLRIASEEFVCQSYVNCCEEDNCNPDYYIPVDNEKENGYVCPICYKDHNTKGCVAYTQEKCTGDATLCAEYIGTFFKPDGSAPGTSFKSCANPSGFKNLGACFGIEEIERVQFQTIEPIESPHN
ncbi:uncharacterized protein [Ranitomeya imitator]|uniref:uncharacterized protein n=1 Tax=Ranitomeya imitator TaxID=111125 RepID=UPI0037E872C8